LVKISHEVTEMFRTPAGGWTKKQLAEWGVRWPPMRGWRRRLALGLDPNIPDSKFPKNKRPMAEPAWHYAVDDAEAERVSMKKLYQEKSGDYSY
jgi:hypothetical protein